VKSLIVFARIIIVGCLWSIVFIEGIRVILLCNWHFDIFWPDHWRQAYTLWKAGWVVKAPKEWAFVIILVTFFPMLITGWWTLCMVAWEDIIYDIITFPLTLYRKFIKTPLNVMTTNNKYGVVKKKSYKQIRPAGVGYRMPISDYGDNSISKPLSYQPPVGSAFSSARSAVTSSPAKTVKKTDIPTTIDHALFRFDDDDDDFDLDIDSFEKTDILKKKEPKKTKSYNSGDDDDYRPKRGKNSDKRQRRTNYGDDDDDDDESEAEERTARRSSKNDDHAARKNTKAEKNGRANKNGREEKSDLVGKDRFDDESSVSPRDPIYDILRQKGYSVISNVIVKDTIIDYVGVSGNEICLCLVDKENGDWLADEELFNGEEPLWFSENSHRVSPVRKLDVARGIIEKRLENEEFEQELKAFLIIQTANVINADDMFEIWDNMNISVTRINRGAPKDIKLFSKALDEAENSITKKELDVIRKFFKNTK